MGLQSFGEPDDESIQCGIEFLLRTQNRDGSWTENETTGTGFPRVFYLKYDSYRNAWPLLALSEQRDLGKLQIGCKRKKHTRAQGELSDANK
jgi:squalene-hopene/tetraprenyl-beta-curcumene cyclase